MISFEEGLAMIREEILYAIDIYYSPTLNRCVRVYHKLGDKHLIIGKGALDLKNAQTGVRRYKIKRSDFILYFKPLSMEYFVIINDRVCVPKEKRSYDHMLAIYRVYHSLVWDVTGSYNHKFRYI